MMTDGEMQAIRVCHIMTADLWAGAEVQLATVSSYLRDRPDVDLSVILFNEGVLARELRRLGIHVMVVDERRNNSIQIVSCLARFLRANRIDIVHTHRNKDNVLGGLAAKMAGVPRLIRTVHGLSEPMSGWAWTKFRCYEALDKAALWLSADRIIAVSRHMAETLERSGYRRSAVIHIHNGVDLSKIRATRARTDVRHELGIDPRELVIGTVGRLSRVKAHACLLRAARLILQKRPDARFVIVGDGPLREELGALARELGIDRDCILVGARTDIFDLVAAMDIFVLPSLSEGIPMALLEAMALGRPVVATAVGGVPEVVEHRTTGLLVRPNDECALADACLELAGDRERAHALGVRARQTVETEFSRERNGRTLVALYRAVASTRPPDATPVASAKAVNPAKLGTLRFSWELARALVEYGGRKVAGALDKGTEKRRMRRVRRNPEILSGVLRSAQSILVVCHGNIIRSPFAARLVAQALGDRGRVSIRSGGLAAVPGKPPHPTALLTASRQGVDLGDHSASPVDREVVTTSDIIFVMDVAQLIAMRLRFPEAEAKTFLLTCLASDTPLEIRDPFNGDASRFQDCFDHISRAVRPIVRTLSHPVTCQ